jgi:hypothetical protein
MNSIGILTAVRPSRDHGIIVCKSPRTCTWKLELLSSDLHTDRKIRYMPKWKVGTRKKIVVDKKGRSMVTRDKLKSRM